MSAISAGNPMPPLKLVTSSVRTLRMPSLRAIAYVRHSSWLVIAVLGELGGVAVPVAASVVDPVDGGVGVDSE